MIYTLFFSRMRHLGEGERAEYAERAAALQARAAGQFPGFVDTKTYVADDGERLTVARFTDLEAQRRWARDAEHRAGQVRGREIYYDRYRLVICEHPRERSWSRGGRDATADEEAR